RARTPRLARPGVLRLPLRCLSPAEPQVREAGRQGDGLHRGADRPGCRRRSDRQHLRRRVAARPGGDPGRGFGRRPDLLLLVRIGSGKRRLLPRRHASPGREARRGTPRVGLSCPEASDRGLRPIPADLGQDPDALSRSRPKRRDAMREVSIIGIGQTAVAEHWDRSIRDLAVEAALKAREDAGVERVDALYVGNMLSGELNGQENLAPLVADAAGLLPIEALKIEAACASGGAAVRAAALAVASGARDYVLAVGVEKMTDLLTDGVTSALAMAADADYEAGHGV